MSRPRVLLVEDDASLRRFVRLALDDLPLTLIECDSVACALERLQEAPVDLILTDLMMPVASGFELLEALRQNPALRAQARLVVLSAGINAAVREQLARFDLWQILVKPVSVLALEECVGRALTAQLQAAKSPPQPDTAMPQAIRSAEQTHAIAEYFQGDTELFDGFLSACLEQFPQDIADADQAVGAQDLKALRLTAHSLKSILLTLGFAKLSAASLALEQACVAADLESARAGWTGLRAGLTEIVAA